MRTSSSPFGTRFSAEAARHVRYVRPELVAEVEFRGWTADKIFGTLHFAVYAKIRTRATSSAKRRRTTSGAKRRDRSRAP